MTTSRGTVVLIEDEEAIADLVRMYFEQEGFRVVHAPTGERGIDAVRDRSPRVVLLDLGLPGIDGIEVCRRIRGLSDVPVIMLTARDTEVDKIVGLEIGADDYVTKPFGMKELLARVRAHLRRGEAVTPAGVQSIRIGTLEIDVARHVIKKSNNPVDLTPKEFELIGFLARNKGLVFSREHLLEKVWGYDYAGDTRTIDVHIRWLRQKLEEDPARPLYILTVRGTGYKLEG